MRRLFLVLLLLLAVALPAAAETTSAEQSANEAAQQELDTAPRYGNLPSYALAPALLARSVVLQHLQMTLFALDTVWVIARLLLLLQLGLVGLFQRWVRQWFRNEWLRGLAFLFLLLLTIEVTDLPLHMYGHHAYVGYGLSVQGWAGWFGDRLKTLLLTVVIGWPLYMLLRLIIREFPRRWWLVFWAASTPLIAGGGFLEPYLIEPLFYHFEPLARSQPHLTQRLEEVANRGHMDIPPERMFLMQASSKQTTLNAYVSGLGSSKRVVVWDTSIQSGTEDQIVAIFGHESGHYVLNHVLIGFVVTTAGLLLAFWIGYHAVQWLIARRGVRWGVLHQRDMGVLALLMLVFAVLSTMVEPLGNAATRRIEHDADVYGQEAIHGIVASPQAVMQSTFQLLGQKSFDNPNPIPAWVWWTSDHPATGRRAAFAAHYDPWTTGRQPKYFLHP